MGVIETREGEVIPAVPKPSHKRNKPTAKQRGQISMKVRREVETRSEGYCECCGKHKNSVWGLQKAHLIRRWKLNETTAQDIADLCGPSVNTGTCHWWIDNTKEGREWAKVFREKLLNEVNP